MGQIVHPRIPVSTYRIQLNRTCTFRDAQNIVPYLHELGVTDLYCSPFLQAMPGSLHGYDVVDPTRLNPEIGGDEEYDNLVQALRRLGMGQIMDVVPNHMGISREANSWWQDVLENGRSSRYATFFDIDWVPLKAELSEKVLLPILGDQYGIVLENQELQLVYEDGRFQVRYYDHCLPIAPKPSAMILSHRLETMMSAMGDHSPDVLELQSIITALKHLPSRSDSTPELVAERYREKEIIRRRLAALVGGSEAIRTFLEENVRLINGTKGDPRSFDLLDALLNDQAYRLAYWRVAAEEINYRRFFDINELAAIRMEEPAVFRDTHQLVFQLIKAGAVTGLRIDHVDGLYDPVDYLRKLQDWAREELPAGSQSEKRPLFLIVEKILGVNESLPATWPVFGTTGYDFLTMVNGLLISRANERMFDTTYARFIRDSTSFDEQAYRCKQLIMRVSMASELNVLGHQLNRLSEQDRRSRDFTLNSLTHAIREIIACFPVYRTYITGGQNGVLDRDRAFLWHAVTKAKRRNPAVSGLVFDFVRDLLLEGTEGLPREERLRFVMKFQQTTSPVTAKGVEDTAFYLYNRLVSLNEVGADPQQFGYPPGIVHQQMRERQARWPASLSATSTHDTKRSEDVRARINVLSELPKLWKEHVTRWSRANRKHKTDLEGEAAPGPNEEYLLYQTLVGAWPLTPLKEDDHARFAERVQAYMAKAIREAKVHTSWVSSDPAYEEAVRRFIDAVLRRTGTNAFLDDFLPFQERIAQYGLYNSLSQLLIKIAAPGVPDFYQGTEVWDFSLVDPDNRRPVDFEARAAMLADVREGCESEAGRPALIRALVDGRADGRIKLFVTMEALRYRRDHHAVFHEGDYAPLDAIGERKDQIFAFARLHGDGTVVAAVPRLLTSVLSDPSRPPIGEEIWSNTAVVMPAWREQTRFRNIFTGEILHTMASGERQTLPAGHLFNTFPVALLEREP